MRILCEEPNSSKLAEVYHSVFSFIIVLSICCYMFSSLNDAGLADPKNLSPDTYKILEITFTTLFTLDLLVRALSLRSCGALGVFQFLLHLLSLNTSYQKEGVRGKRGGVHMRLKRVGEDI